MAIFAREWWNNVRSLANFRGRLDIWGAIYDQVIPVRHAQALAKSLPRANYRELKSGHGWADANEVDLSE